MAITLEGTASGGTTFQSNPSCSLACGSTADRCVVAMVVTDRGGATTIDSCTCNGNAMTAAAVYNHPSGYDSRIFYIAGDSNIASGSNTVAATLSDANTRPAVYAVAYSGVDTASPCSGLTNNNGNINANTTWTVTSATNDVVVALFSFISSTTATGGTDTTVRFGPTSVNTVMCTIMDEPGSTSTTISATLGGNREWWGTALSVKAAAGASGVPKTNRMLMGVG